MEPLERFALPKHALLLVDSAPVIYVLEAHPEFAVRFRPLFEAHAAGEVQLAVSTVTIAEVLTGPLRAGDEALATQYRAILESWQVVDLTVDVAVTAARLRAASGLKLVDAVQAASAMVLNAHALVTHDRDFSRVPSLRVLS